MFSDTRNICIPKRNTTLHFNKTKKNKVGDKDDFYPFAFPSNSKFNTNLLSTYYQLNFNLKLRKFQSIQKANKHIWTQILKNELLINVSKTSSELVK